MPMNNNPLQDQDVPPRKTSMVPIAIALIISLIIGVVGYGYFFSGEIPTN